MNLFSLKDAEAFVATGKKEFRHSRETLLTPGARDCLTEAGIKVVFDASAAPAPAASPSAPAATKAGGGSPGEFERLFNSPEARSLKEQICDIGRRLWMREYTDGNGGNISCRLGNYFICTPTGVSKGFLKPEMLCLVDMAGNQLAGTWKRTSEINTHMAIYSVVPEAKAVVHAHPVHATAYAIAGLEPPPCLIPEIEVFVGRVPVAPYRTPGSAEMAEVISPLAPKHQSIMMGNHGLICWGTSVEDAYFKMEITDAYCRTLVVASHLPSNRTSIPGDKLQELLDLKKKLGLPDSREGLKPEQLCGCDPWEMISDRPKACATTAQPAGPDTSKLTNAELEGLVQAVTNQILETLQKQKS
ncbi:MAG: class II aldolase/adducin family protein [Puniceicoccaceae bacterium]|nr:MAG: class II aldolase/adducin family protein [Puniceicoccaceae bacterium]